MDLTTLTEPPLLYVVLAVAALLIGLAVWGFVASARRRRERDELRERYGTEFDRAVSEHGSRRAAVADLRARESEHEALSLRDLNEPDLALVRQHMVQAQFRFVEDPSDALLRVERVMTEVLRAKGYPLPDQAQAARLFSVDHPEHAEAVRGVFAKSTDGDVDDLRSRFLEARKTIQEVTGVSYVLADGGAEANPDATSTDHDAPVGDLRVEHEAQPATTTGASRRSQT